MESDRYSDSDERFEKNSAKSGAQQADSFSDTAARVLKQIAHQVKDFVDDPNKLERLLQRLERKLQAIPAINTRKFGKVDIGEKLSLIPTQGSVVRSYCRKEYRGISVKSLALMAIGLLYFVSPWDLIPERIFLLGLADDVFVVNLILNHIKSELHAYREWRSANGQDRI